MQPSFIHYMPDFVYITLNTVIDFMDDDPNSRLPESVQKVVHAGKICLVIVAGSVFLIVYLPSACGFKFYSWVKMKYEWPSTRRAREEREEEDRKRRVEMETQMEKNRRSVARRRWPRRLGKRERGLSVGREGVMVVGEVMEERTVGLVVGKENSQLVKRKTHVQEGSRLFDLPFEIRRQIWEDVLCGYVIYISFADGYRRMQHQRCKVGGEEWRCRVQSKQKGALDAWGQRDLLSLLMSCRRMYTESIEILYKKNRFNFDRFEDVLKLSLTLVPERMQWMRDIQWREHTNLFSWSSTGTYQLSHITKSVNDGIPWLRCLDEENCKCIACLLDRVDVNTADMKEVLAQWHESHQSFLAEAVAVAVDGKPL